MKTCRISSLLLALLVLVTAIFNPVRLEKRVIQVRDTGIVTNTSSQPRVSDALHVKHDPYVLQNGKKLFSLEDHKIPRSLDETPFLDRQKPEVPVSVKSWTNFGDKAFRVILPFLWYIQKQDGF